ncbi:MAG: methyltransferase domain-containing protein [Candidatus Nanoarchaeia archaeon]|nr:methyltransferase domain-containing protein [Candidatus Nanoarchaeia archaeon]
MTYDDKVILIDLRTQKEYFKNNNKEFQTQFGTLTVEQLQSDDSHIETEKGYKYLKIKPQFIDKYNHKRRQSQIMDIKDTGYIITRCGITKDSVVAESGCGSGGFSTIVAKICKKIYSFDNREEHIDVVKENMKILDIDNIELKLKDIYTDEIDIEEKVDVFLLDLPEPHNAMKNAIKNTKKYGYIVCYCPNINQNQLLVNYLLENHNEELKIEETMEVLNIKWICKERSARPFYKDTIHSGFMTFLRKL